MILSAIPGAFLMHCHALDFLSCISVLLPFIGHLEIWVREFILL